MYARFSAVLTFNPAALHLSAVSDLAASFLQPDTLHVFAFIDTTQTSHAHVTVLLPYIIYCLSSFSYSTLALR